MRPLERIHADLKTALTAGDVNALESLTKEAHPWAIYLNVKVTLTSSRSARVTYKTDDKTTEHEVFMPAAKALKLDLITHGQRPTVTGNQIQRTIHYLDKQGATEALNELKDAIENAAIAYAREHLLYIPDIDSKSGAVDWRQPDASAWDRNASLNVELTVQKAAAAMAASPALETAFRGLVDKGERIFLSDYDWGRHGHRQGMRSEKIRAEDRRLAEHALNLVESLREEIDNLPTRTKPRVTSNEKPYWTSMLLGAVVEKNAELVHKLSNLIIGQVDLAEASERTTVRPERPTVQLKLRHHDLNPRSWTLKTPTTGNLLIPLDEALPLVTKKLADDVARDMEAWLQEKPEHVTETTRKLLADAPDIFRAYTEDGSVPLLIPEPGEAPWDETERNFRNARRALAATHTDEEPRTAILWPENPDRENLPRLAEQAREEIADGNRLSIRRIMKKLAPGGRHIHANAAPPQITVDAAQDDGTVTVTLALDTLGWPHEPPADCLVPSTALIIAKQNHGKVDAESIQNAVDAIERNGDIDVALALAAFLAAEPLLVKTDDDKPVPITFTRYRKHAAVKRYNTALENWTPGTDGIDETPSAAAPPTV